MKRWLAGVALLIPTTVVAVVLIVVVVRLAPEWLASGGKDNAAEVGRVRTALLAVLAGGVALWGAIYTARTFGLNRQGQITDRFTHAIDQLGEDKVEIQLGGIFALERIARDSPPDRGPIVEVLTAYVREHAPWPPPTIDPPPEVPTSLAPRICAAPSSWRRT
jgi:hypothetical protein